MESVRLSCTGAGDFAETKCMICQQITPEKLITTQNGCKRIRAASDIRNDCVSKRMKLIPDESKFVYHVSNECYKTYTNANLLRRIQKREKMHESLLSSEITDSPLGVATRSHCAERSPPNPADERSVKHSMKCIICDRMSCHTNESSQNIVYPRRIEPLHFCRQQISSRMTFSVEFVISKTSMPFLELICITIDIV